VTTKYFMMHTPQKNYDSFLKIYTTWHRDLTQYTEANLLQKATSDSWTLGQVYNHLISSTLNFHLRQVAACSASDENSTKRKNFKGFLAYNILNGFPPIKIKVPPSDIYTPKQPSTKEEISKNLETVKLAMMETLDKLNTTHKGKTAHPGFSYINAQEWYRMVEMHWRHHLRQKKEIEKNFTNT
jgi:hypothetical protein